MVCVLSLKGIFSSLEKCCFISREEQGAVEKDNLDWF